VDNNTNPNDLWHLLNLLWIAVVGGFWKVFSGKASKESVTAVRRAVEEKHAENKDRLEYIIGKLDRMSETLTDVQIDVGRLKGRAGVNGHP
jgi:hypothetical protein